MPDNTRNELVDAVIDGVHGLTRLAWRALTGEDKAKLTEQAIAERVITGLWSLLRAELQAESAKWELVASVSEMEERVRGVMDAFVPKGTIPALGIEVEEVPADVELTLSDGTKLVIPDTPPKPMATKRKGKRR